MDKPVLDALTTSPLKRRLSIAKTSLNIGKRWAINRVAGALSSQENQDERNKAFMHEQAQYLANELGKLKGSVVKIGQMLALYGEHILPSEVVSALHGLDDSTATLSWSAIYQAIYSELGDKISELEIEPTPIGTASLAQVHRAVIRSTGERVVLKVQYPKVADAIEADLSLFKHLLKITNTVPQTRALDEW